MRDATFLLVILVFFAVAVRFVRGCEWISRERE